MATCSMSGALLLRRRVFDLRYGWRDGGSGGIKVGKEGGLEEGVEGDWGGELGFESLGRRYCI